MSRRRALVVHTRMPAFDRDSGSQDIDNTVQFLLRAGWQVTFLAREEQGIAEERHAQRLRRLGVETHAGLAAAGPLLRAGDFDLALIAFWELAAELIPLVRERSPRTKVVVNSMDLHFLRNARRSFGQRSRLDRTFGEEAADELNTYHAADAVIAVSTKERDLLADFVGEERVFVVPIADDIPRSGVVLDGRRGMYFVGNFRHVPNQEAVEYLCGEVLPLIDPPLLERHPLTVLGNWLDRVDLRVDPDAPGIRMIGWVPSVRPYVERARIGVVPLLYGAGVKRKVIQSMMAGTPVVTTPVGAEGLDLVRGEHALVAVDAGDLAAGITRLLTDDALWRRLADAGAAHVDARHGIGVVEQRFNTVLDEVMGCRERSTTRTRSFAYEREPAGQVIRRRMQMIAGPGEVVLVASGGDDDLLDLGARPCWPFPQARDGAWAGYDPVDGPAAINHLEAQRARDARWFVLPKAMFGWRHRYPELFEHLESVYRRVHEDEHAIVYDLAGMGGSAPVLAATPQVRVGVVGTYAADRTGPPPALVAELGASAQLVVEQDWSPSRGTVGQAPAARDGSDVDYVVHVTDDVLLPAGFLDTLIATQVTLAADRVQPAHLAGPEGGPPITERHLGTVAREVDRVTPLPLLSRRARTAPDGPVLLTDNVTVGLRRALPVDADAPVWVRRVWCVDEEGRPAAWTRPEPPAPPRISVLVATYQRPELLRECLMSFADQTLGREEYEVVVVDDGSEGDDLAAVLAEFTPRMQIVGLRIEHSGRSAAKNHAVLLARAPVVLFFDDDDRAAPDYLERHLVAHERRPAEAVAILGHTDWAPELERSPLMHYITDVDRLMFAYERLRDGQTLDWRGFWEGRISCKRSLLVRHGLHDQRLAYSIDVEMGWRLAPAGLRVVYDASARSFMARPIDFDAFCDRTEAKGRAHAVISSLHPGTEMAERLHLDAATKLWKEQGLEEHELRQRVAMLEDRCAAEPAVLPQLHAAYRDAFRLLHAKGVTEATEGDRPMAASPVTVPPLVGSGPALVHDGTPPDAGGEPQISITVPVWSRTPQLAEMARRTIERLWDVARLATEVVVVDNGSPFEIPLPAKVYRYDENRGVSTGWNTGIRLSRAPVIAVLNSDCRVEPGWDEALYEAVGDGRRIAFPYTDHCDGLGFSRPDQGGTAGWCFMLTRTIYEEIGPFDEWFSPAFCEDTDYWHRAWQAGIELSPVPAARVVHARRTSSHDRSDLLLQAHRYKYGWKHGVDPDRAPPYYHRDVVDYVGTAHTSARPRR